MTEPTTGEERLTQANIDKLRAYWSDELTPKHGQIEEYGLRLIAGAEQAEAQLAEAAKWLATCRKYLRRKRSLSPAFYAQMKRLDTFLAGLSTTKEECEFGCTVDKGGQHHPGCAEVVSLARDPACERVLVCPGCASGDELWKCATHHGVWPSGKKRCPAALAGNVTT